MTKNSYCNISRLPITLVHNESFRHSKNNSSLSGSVGPCASRTNTILNNTEETHRDNVPELSDKIDTMGYRLLPAIAFQTDNCEHN